MISKKVQFNKWVCIEKVFDTQPWAFATTYDNIFRDRYLKSIGLKMLLKESLLIFEGTTARLCHIEKYFNSHVKEVFNKFINTPSWAEKLCEINRIELNNLKKTEPTLDNLYEYFILLQKARVSAWPLAIVDWNKQLFSSYLKQKTGDKIFLKLTTNYNAYYEKKVNSNLRRLFKLARKIIVLKKKRMEIFQSAFEKLNPIWKLEPDLQYTYPWELKYTNLPKNIKERKQFHLLYSTLNKREVLFGNEAKKFLTQLSFKKLKTHNSITNKSINGSVAYDGESTGIVKIVNSIQDLYKVENGDILVSHMTNPSFSTAFKKCVAIITDLGGLTCHAAIIARELKKPCIIGTKIATQVLKDGDLVEVDANQGIVRKIK